MALAESIPRAQRKRVFPCTYILSNLYSDCAHVPTICPPRLGDASSLLSYMLKSDALCKLSQLSRALPRRPSSAIGKSSKANSASSQEGV